MSMNSSSSRLTVWRVIFLTLLCQCWTQALGNSQAEVVDAAGKRSISEEELAEFMAENELAEARLKPEEAMHHDREMVSEEEEEDSDLLSADKRNPYSFGLGKRGGYGNEYGFGLGKRNPYAFGLGKRFAQMQLGKKEDPIYAFGLGKRNPYAFGLGKRNQYAFGLGKRNPYAFGLGKKRDPYAFGLGKRDPYSFGLGK